MSCPYGGALRRLSIGKLSTRFNMGFTITVPLRNYASGRALPQYALYIKNGTAAMITHMKRNWFRNDNRRASRSFLANEGSLMY